MESAGRNDLCPCGSGRRYKDCCSPGARASQDAVLRDGAIREAALTKLLTFAFQPAFDADHSIAEVLFWGDHLRRAEPGTVQQLLESDETSIKYNSWFLFDREVDGAGTVADLFLEEQASGLSEAEWRVLDAVSRVPLRLFEVEPMQRGRVRLVDLWTGERSFVAPRQTAHAIVTWDVLGARLAADGAGGYRFEGGLYVYPADTKKALLARFHAAHRRYRRSAAGDDPAMFFRQQGPLFHHLWLELVAFPEAPRLLTAEGDPLMFCRAVFESAQVEEVRKLIACQPDVKRVADRRVVLHEATDGGGREIGWWSFEGPRIVLETTSQARAARGRAWLEGVAGGLVRYRATALETLDHAMQALRRPAAATAQPVEEADAAAVRKLYDRHYQSWLDRPEPELGNRSPRAAAHTKTCRPQLVELLKRLENAAERAALAGRPPYDFRWIWTELNLTRPDGGK
jgi:hypothetical protein